MKRRHLYATIISFSSLYAGIQPSAGVIFVPSDTSVGDWDDATKTYTLTQDLTEPIEIVSNGITLDGAGHTLISSLVYPYLDCGISLYGRIGVTVKDLTIGKFGPGIYLLNSNNNTLTGNTVSDCSMSGIYLFNSSNNTLTGNRVSNSIWGIFVNSHSNKNTMKDNAVLDQRRGGMILSNCCEENILMGNTASNNFGSGVVLWDDCNANTVAGNTIESNKEHGIWLVRSHVNQIYSNNFIGNAQQASVRYSSGNVFSLPAPHGGNYWSNWTNPHNNVCGCLDRPYIFPGGHDDLPWVAPNCWDLFALQQMLELLKEQVVVLRSNKDISIGLEAKIKAALDVLDDFNENNDAVATNSLEAFINAVESMRGSTISEEQAETLTTTARQIIDLLVAE